MLTYDSTVVRPWVLSTPELLVHFEQLLKVTNKNDADKYGKIAMRMVFVHYILTSPALTQQYLSLLNSKDVKTDEILVNFILDKINQYGWIRFFVALRLAIHELMKRNPNNRRRLEKSVELLEQIPTTVQL